MIDLDRVCTFWENNPLWTGGSVYEAGSAQFFNVHRKVNYSDCVGGKFDLRFLPPPRPNGQTMKILELGCGIGFWVTEFALRGLCNLHAAELTDQELRLTKRRLEACGVIAELSQQNAEKLTYSDGSFDHINCQGVAHYTEKAINEIARVLKPGGTASISVYYRNPILRFWPYMRWIGWSLAKLGGGLKGRGRKKILDIDEIVRLYDGVDNPIGKAILEESL